MARSSALERLEARAAGTSVRLLGRNPAQLTVRLFRRFVDVRVTGLAAEMTYYMLLSLIPLATALGASLGLLRHVVSPRQVEAMEDAILDGLGVVLSPEVAGDVSPLVQRLLAQEQAGVAVGGLAVSLWLGSRVFRAAIRALDDAYEAPERRKLLAQWGLSLAFALGAVVTVTVLLGMVVIGPLLGGGRRIADWAGFGTLFEVLWAVARWPVAFLVVVAFLIWLYRMGPNVRNTWRDCLPGALMAAVGLVVVGTGFRLYLQVAGPAAPDVGTGDEVVAIAGQVLGAVIAGVLLVWVSSIAMLLGGVLNAEWAALAPRASHRDGIDGPLPAEAAEAG